MSKIYIIYHNNCHDGFGAAFCAWQKYTNNALYIPKDYGSTLPEIEDNSEVYIMDVSFKREALIELNSRVKKLVVLDHHKTAEAELSGLDFCVFDMNKSGAMLAWEYFHPETEAPYFIKLIEDRDLWRYKFKDTLKFQSAINLLPFDFEAWDKAMPKKIQLLKQGETVLAYMKNTMERTIDTFACFISFCGHNNIPVANEPFLQSDLCNLMLDRFNTPFALAYVVTPDGFVKWSIRSKAQENPFDTTVISKQFGGGGHLNASGFKTSIEFLDEVMKTAKKIK